MEVAFKHRWTGGREEISTRATCPECGRHHYVKSFSARETCPYCKEHPLPVRNYEKPNLPWVLVKDTSPADCRFNKGARFTKLEIEWMINSETIPAGSVFRNIHTKEILEIGR